MIAMAEKRRPKAMKTTREVGLLWLGMAFAEGTWIAILALEMGEQL